MTDILKEDPVEIPKYIGYLFSSGQINLLNANPEVRGFIKKIHTLIINKGNETTKGDIYFTLGYLRDSLNRIGNDESTQGILDIMIDYCARNNDQLFTRSGERNHKDAPVVANSFEDRRKSTGVVVDSQRAVQEITKTP